MEYQILTQDSPMTWCTQSVDVTQTLVVHALKVTVRDTELLAAVTVK